MIYFLLVIEESSRDMTSQYVFCPPPIESDLSHESKEPDYDEDQDQLEEK
jgi:hypothetical protein